MASVVGTYARAFADVVMSTKADPARMLAELRTMEAILAESADLRTLITALPEQAVVLDLPLPGGLWGVLGRFTVPYVARVNRTIHQAAQARCLPVAEVSTHFRPPWPGKFASDYFHPSQAGYRDWARALLAALPSAPRWAETVPVR